LEDIPVFAKSGAIVPLAPDSGWSGVENPGFLRVVVFPGADNRFELYEDDGDTTDYLRGRYALTAFVQEWHGDKLHFRIAPVAGEAGLAPAERTYELCLRGIARPASIAVAVNGSPVATSFEYDATTQSVRLAPVTLTPADTLEVTVSAEGDMLLARGSRSAATLRRLLTAFRLDTRLKERIDREWPMVTSGAVSLRSFSGLSDAQIAALESLF
jgi:hypothetical protein